MQQVPLDSSPNQNFDITLFVNGKNVDFNLFFSWNNTAKYWTMDIRDKSKKPLACNIPLYANANLLAGLEYLEIGSVFLIKLSDINADTPDLNTINTDFALLWGDNVDVD